MRSLDDTMAARRRNSHSGFPAKKATGFASCSTRFASGHDNLRGITSAQPQHPTLKEEPMTTYANRIKALVDNAEITDTDLDDNGKLTQEAIERVASLSSQPLSSVDLFNLEKAAGMKLLWQEFDRLVERGELQPYRDEDGELCYRWWDASQAVVQ
jgi:hypothetical protein